MELLGQIPIQWMLFFILFGITGVVPLIAALYLLLRRSNAIAPGVTPPERLRRWTAAFFAVASLTHVWWFLFYVYSGDQKSVAFMVIVMLDCVTLFTTFAGTLLSMLQNRRRSMWPVLIAMIPFLLLWAAYMVYPNQLIEQIVIVYLLLVALLFTVYMVVAIRQYGQWLNDNYADLENKKVWLCQMVSLVCMLLFVLYIFANDMVYIWLLHIIELVLVGLLLWRVETLPLLKSTPPHPDTAAVSAHHYRPCPDRKTVDRELHRSAALLAARSHPAAAGPGRWHQPLLSQPVFLASGHHLQHLYQQPAHQPLHQPLPGVSLYRTARRCPAAGTGERLPQLQHVRPRLHAAHRPERHCLDARHRGVVFSVIMHIIKKYRIFVAR